MDSVDLRERPLDEQDKVWLAGQLKDRKRSLKNMNRCYKLSTSTLSYYHVRTKRGLKLYKCAGRPAALDDQSLNIVVDSLAETPDLEDCHLKALIHAEYDATYARKHRHADEDELEAKKSLSRRSVGRYVDYFRKSQV
jgi:transposase